MIIPIQPLVVLGIISFLTLFILFGAVWQVLMASAVISIVGGSVVQYLQPKNETELNQELYNVLYSLHNVLLPRLIVQLDYACQDSANSVDQLSHLFRQLSEHSTRISGQLASKELTSEQSQRLADKMQATHSQIIMLLQFGDRTQQMQSGVFEAMNLISHQVDAVLNDPAKAEVYFDEAKLVEAIDNIESRTAVDEGSNKEEVTFF
ncbi:hypothetical protein EK599_03460 [Vibrio sp. T187]|uniref:hypothetical protein n=1 Tax=Vibrio TaxID=662 RepID=UPI0010C9D94C|nr:MULTISPECIES: hypothetical protein [Vibrio]MBW3694736.1 hypothetical protein [Vibrio sp. T187]